MLVPIVQQERDRRKKKERHHLSGRKLVSTVGSLPSFPERSLVASAVSAKKHKRNYLINMKKQRISSDVSDVKYQYKCEHLIASNCHGTKNWNQVRKLK